MKVKVRMLAYEDRSPGVYKVRQVSIPEMEWMMAHVLTSEMELIWYYGQNDFQPLQCCSVSCGDVIELRGDLYLITFNGHRKISEQFFQCLMEKSREEYNLCVMRTGGNRKGGA